jgi:hypothetical protein
MRGIMRKRRNRKRRIHNRRRIQERRRARGIGIHGRRRRICM